MAIETAASSTTLCYRGKYGYFIDAAILYFHPSSEVEVYHLTEHSFLHDIQRLN